MEEAFTPEDRAALYRIIESRRDVRAFRSDPVPNEVLFRILTAAHHGPSVGFMQPWNFLVIRDPGTKRFVKAMCEAENGRAAMNYAGDRATLYRSLKLEGIEEAPINLCVTCDRLRSGPHVLGRNTIVDTDLYSTCCAIENLWLAARAPISYLFWAIDLSGTARTCVTSSAAPWISLDELSKELKG